MRVAIPNEAARLRAMAQATADWPFRMWNFGEAIALDALLEAASRLNEPAWEPHMAALCLASIGNGLGQTPGASSRRSPLSGRGSNTCRPA